MRRRQHLRGTRRINPNEAPNAHGNWIGSPGNEDYIFVDRCLEDSDCSLGELCNTATGGCVLAADYPESCSSDLDCPRGPEGEILSCDTARSLCLPAAKCEDNQQCCDRSGVVCSQTQGLCLPLQDECTPTPGDELESTCPLSPQATDECPDGLFCSNDGQCVQCQCDDDCGSPALKCRIYDGTCVAASYCEQDSDCDTQEVCKIDVNECVDRCDPNQNDSCPPQSFCDEELLYCRNNSERPALKMGSPLTMRVKTQRHSISVITMTLSASLPFAMLRPTSSYSHLMRRQSSGFCQCGRTS